MSLFLKQSKYKNGRIYLSIVNGYRKNGKVIQDTIKKLGYLDILEKEFSDPISHFKELVETMKLEDNLINEIPSKINPNEKIDNEDTVLNVGYGILKRIYEEMDLKNFFKNKQSKLNIEYDLNDMLPSTLIKLEHIPNILLISVTLDVSNELKSNSVKPLQ